MTTIPSNPPITLKVLNHSLLQAGIVQFFLPGVVAPAGFIEIQNPNQPDQQLTEALTIAGVVTPYSSPAEYLSKTPKEQVLKDLMPWIRDFIARIVAKANAILGKTPATVSTGPITAPSYYGSSIEVFSDIVSRIKFTGNADGSVNGSL